MFLLFALACALSDPTTTGKEDSTVEDSTLEDSALDDSALDDSDAEGSDSGQGADPVTFDEVMGVLSAHCGECHGPSYVGTFIAEGDAAATYALLLSGVPHVDAEARYVVPGQPESSLIVQKMGEEPAFGTKMPPYGAEGGALDEEQIAVVRAWIAEGAEGP